MKRVRRVCHRPSTHVAARALAEDRRTEDLRGDEIAG